MKRIISAIIVLALMLQLFPSTIAFADVTPTIGVATAYGKLGDTVTVSVAISNNTSFSSGNFEIQYDSNSLKIVSASPGSLISSMTPTINTGYAEDSVKVTWAGLNSIADVQGELCNLTFEIIGDNDSEAVVAVKNSRLYNFDLDSITHNCVDGKVVIEQDTTQNIILNVASLEGEQGEVVTIDVNISEASNVCSGNFAVEYDNNKLQIVSATAGTLIQAMSPSINTNFSENSVKVTWAGLNPITEAGAICHISFMVKEDAVCGVTDVKISNSKLYDLDLNSLNNSTDKGTITILEKSLPIELFVNGGNVNRGENVTVSIDVSENSNMYGGNATIEYDTTAFELVNSEIGDLIKNSSPILNTAYQGNKIRVVWAGTSPITNGGTLCELTFKAKGNASYGGNAISITASNLYDENSERINYNISNGYIVVNGGENKINSFEKQMSIDKTLDDLWYEIQLGKNQGCNVSISPVATAGTFNLQILDKDGNIINSSLYNINVASNNTGYIEFFSPVEDKYYIVIKSDVSGIVNLCVDRFWTSVLSSDESRTKTDTFNTAKYIKEGNYQKTNDVELYRFNAISSKPFTITITNRNTVENNPKLTVYNSQKEVVAENDVISLVGNKTSITYTPEKSDVFYVGIPSCKGYQYSINYTGIEQDKDTDKDGLYDSLEYFYLSNVGAKDTDGDGTSDFEEAKNGTNPIAYSVYGADDANNATSKNKAVSLPVMNKYFEVNKTSENPIVYKIDLNAGEELRLNFKGSTLKKNMQCAIYSTSYSRIVYCSSDGEYKNLEYSISTAGTYYIVISGGVGTYTLKALIANAAKITYSIQKQIPTLSSESKKYSNDNIKNYQVEIYNKTKDIYLKNLDMRADYVFLAGQNVAVNDELQIKLTHRQSQTVEYTTSVILDAERNANVKLTPVQKGTIKFPYSEEKNDKISVRVYIFDENGEQIKDTSLYQKNSFVGECYDSGNYSIVLIKARNNLKRLKTLPEYDKMGLVEGKDYVKRDFQIVDGTITSLNSAVVPYLDETSLYYIDITTSNYVTDSETVLNNGLIGVKLNYKFKDSVKDYIDRMTVNIDIPDNVMFVSGSLTVDGVLSTNVSEAIDGGSLTVGVDNTEGIIRFNIRPTYISDLESSASITFYKDGTRYEDPIGSFSVNMPYITLSAPQLTNSKQIEVSGVSTSETDVYIYDGEVLIGTTKTNKSGIYSLKCSLYNAHSDSKHYITARTIIDGTEYSSNQESVTYYPKSPSVSQLTMYHSGNEYLLLDEEKTYNPIVVFESGSKFTFKLYMENSSEIGELFITSTRNNEVKYLQATYDEKNGYWYTSGFFDPYNTSYVPGTLSVKYSLKGSDVYFDRNASVNISDVSEELPDEWKNATVEITSKTDNEIQAKITLDNEAKDAANITQKTYSVPSHYTEEYLLNNGFVKSNTSTGANSYAKVEYKENEKGKEYDSLGAIFVDLDEQIVEDFSLDVIRDYTFEGLLGDTMGGIASIGYSAVTEVATFYGRSVNFVELENKIAQSNLSAEEKEKAYNKLKVNAVLFGGYTACKYAFVALSAACLVSGVAAPVGFVLSGLSAIASNIFDDVYTASMETFEENLDVKSYRIRVRYSIDPSGYVYEAVSSNRIEGVTTTAYWIEPEYIDENGNGDISKAIVWDATEYAQINPLVTDKNGRYAWNVPEGLWQVKYEKEGYETTYSDWLPVPPPQTDVNIGMISLSAPTVENVYMYKDSASIEFSQYMDSSTINDSNIKIYDSTNGNVELSVSPLDGGITENEKTYSKVFIVEFENSVILGKSYTVEISDNVSNYAGNNLESTYKSSVSVDNEITDIKVSDTVNVLIGSDAVIPVQLLSDAEVGEATLLCDVELSDFATVKDVIYEDNIYYITIEPHLTGMTDMKISVDGTTLEKTIELNIVNEEVPTSDMSITAKITSTNSIKATVVNNTDDSLTPMLLAAIYTTDGKLIDLQTQPIDVVPTETKDIDVSFSENVVIKSEYIIKVFIWDSMTTLKPISNSFIAN